jgi:hypothetical protein
MAQMYGNRLSIRFDVSVLTGPLFDVSMTVQNENYLTQTIETTVQYIFNQPFAPIFNYYSDYYVDIISGYYDTRLRFYFDYDVTAYYDMRRTQYSLISRDDPSLYYSFVFDGYLGISSFYTYYDHVIIDEYNLVGDISNSIIPTVDQYQAFIEIRVPVDEEDFAGKIFDVAAIVTTYSGGVQYEYSSVMCYLV